MSRKRSTAGRSILQLGESALEEAPLRLLSGEGKRSLVRGPRFSPSAQPPAQIRPGRVRQAVARQIAARQDGVDQQQPGFGAVAHRYRHGAIQLDHG